MAYDGELSVRDVLTRARDYLQEHGREKYRIANLDGGRSVCTWGALAIGSGVRPPDGTQEGNLRFIRAAGAADVSQYAHALRAISVCSFNNASDDETVIARFNEAIANAV